MFSLKNKNIAVFGLGVSGISAVKLLGALGAHVYAINQGPKEAWAKSPGVLDSVPLTFCFSEEEFKFDHNLACDFFDLLILSPGIPRHHRVAKLMLATNPTMPIWGEIELAYQSLIAEGQLSKMVGVTGTNGKTTTTTLIGELLKCGQKDVFVGGNIGVPFCDYAYEVLVERRKKCDIIVLELSSFQLESLEKFHLDVALLLNIFQNHGERYQTIEEYAHSKFLIVNHFCSQDFLIYAQDFPLIESWAQTVHCQKVALSYSSLKKYFQAQSLDISGYKLPGEHNQMNLAFAVAVALHFGVDKKAMMSAINKLKGVPHRISYVTQGENALFSHLKIYNDAKSTNWDATLTAISAVASFGLPITLIVGGKKRGVGDEIAPYLNEIQKHVKELYLIGEMGPVIYQEISQGHFNLNSTFRYHMVGTLQGVKEHLLTQSPKLEGVLLFSPAFPSFDQFQNYADRGRHFEKLFH